MVVSGWVIEPGKITGATINSEAVSNVTNTLALGRLIYTDYIYLFQVAGLILLVAMVGAIVLTLRRREGVKRQRIADQLDRTPEDAMEVVKVDSGSGI